ncbi:MAG: CopD family protein [Steroidobacteraceae bacterium]|jgi:putative copper resistance protein D
MTALGFGDAALVAAKAVTYAATLSASGAVFFLFYAHDLIEPAHARDIRRLIRMLLIVSAIASCAKVSATAASMSGDLSGMFDPGLARMILQSGEGWATLVRLIGLLLMIPAARPPPPRVLVGAVLGATSFAWTGHVHALAAAWAGAGVLAVHLLAAAFWLGGLIPLLAAARGADLARVAATAARFGAYALIVVGILIAAGACLLGLLLQRVADLWSTGYGRCVLAKISLVACLLAFAALNRLRLTPGLLAGDARALPPLRTSIKFELAIAALILIVTAAMTALTGPAGLD